MALVQKLDLRQSQTLVMTPQLQQAIKLLQLSNLEIGEYVAQELQQNPLLEEGGPDLEQPNGRGEGEQEGAASNGDDRAATADTQAVQIESGVISETIVESPDADGGGLDERIGSLSYSGSGREF